MAVMHADNPFTEIVQKEFYLERLDQCFCEVSYAGFIYVCSIIYAGSKHVLYTLSAVHMWICITYTQRARKDVHHFCKGYFI